MKTFLQILKKNAEIDAVIEKFFSEQMRLAIQAEAERIGREILYDQSKHSNPIQTSNRVDDTQR